MKGVVIPIGVFEGTLVSELPIRYCFGVQHRLKEMVMNKELSPSSRYALCVIERIHPDDAANAAAVERMIVRHKMKYDTFDDDRFRTWVQERPRRRRLQVLWLGMPYCNRLAKPNKKTSLADWESRLGERDDTYFRRSQEDES